MLKLLYKYPESDYSIVKIDEGFYYGGNGLSGGFAWTVELFLKWEPYIERAKENDPIPEQVLDFLEVYADKAAEEMGKRAEERGTNKVAILIDSHGNVKKWV